jgi:hypothetical protein
LSIRLLEDQIQENCKVVKEQEDRHSCLLRPAADSQTRMSGLLKRGTLRFSYLKIQENF